MPTSGDLKSGDSLFFTTPPPWNFNGFPPTTNWPSPQWEWLRTLYKSYLRYILSKFAVIVFTCFDDRIIFVSDWIRAKMPQKPYCECEKFKFRAKNGLDLKLRHRQAPKMISSGRYRDPYGRAGDLCRIWESWHVCLCCSYNFGWPLNVERMVDVMWCAARCLVLSARRGRYYSEALSLFNRLLPSSKNPHFQCKMRLRAQPFLWKWLLFAWEWKMIFISKAEHLPSFWNRGPGELGNGLFST